MKPEQSPGNETGGISCYVSATGFLSQSGQLATFLTDNLFSEYISVGVSVRICAASGPHFRKRTLDSLPTQVAAVHG
jgi:hypothetical protein